VCVSLICTPSYELIETNVSAGEFRGVVLLSTGHYAMKYGEFGFDEDKNKLDVHDRCIFYIYIYIYTYTGKHTRNSLNETSELDAPFIIRGGGSRLNLRR